MRPLTLEQSLVLLQRERAIVSAQALVLARARNAALALGPQDRALAQPDFTLAANAALRYLLPET